MNISYELAKELKDAEFPQEEARSYYCAGHDGSFELSVIDYYREDETHIAIPALSEIIEACGSVCLMVGPDKSVAFNNHNPMESTERAQGPTPEEAVARLWLALNKK